MILGFFNLEIEMWADFVFQFHLDYRQALYHEHFSSYNKLLTLCKLAQNDKFECFYNRSRSRVKQQICSLICVICKKALKKRICMPI